MEKKLQEIINIVLKKQGKEELHDFSEAVSLRKDLDFDSLMLAELTVRIEDEFDIDVFRDGPVDTLLEILKKLS